MIFRDYSLKPLFFPNYFDIFHKERVYFSWLVSSYINSVPNTSELNEIQCIMETKQTFIIYRNIHSLSNIPLVLYCFQSCGWFDNMIVLSLYCNTKEFIISSLNWYTMFMETTQVKTRSSLIVLFIGNKNGQNILSVHSSKILKYLEIKLNKRQDNV